MQDVCDLFVIESLRDDFPHEGELLCNILRRIGKNPIYMVVKNKDELINALEIFKLSNYKYIHFSCHGTETSITLSESGDLSYKDFALLSLGCFNSKRVFFSACLLGNDRFSNEIAFNNTGIQSIIAPINEIHEGYAFAMWTSFYTALFMPKKASPSTVTETVNISFHDLIRLLGKILAIFGEPIHCSYHETVKNILYHKKLIPSIGIKNLSPFSSIKAYSQTHLGSHANNASQQTDV